MEEGIIHSLKLTSIGPGNVTGFDAVFEPGDTDLAMKLHYLRGVYYFKKEAFEGITTLNVKEPLFNWLNQYPVPCGRFRRSESGRAYIKCNDCGVRFSHAKCDKTVDEWLELKDDALEARLCANHVVGPELQFSPTVFLQMTEFRCGGVAMGLSWAHVLGDGFSTAKFMNMLGRCISGLKQEKPINPAQYQNNSRISDGAPNVKEDPISIERVDPVGDNWVYAAPCKMETFSFHVTPPQLSHLQSKLAENGGDSAPFEALTAAIWRCVARVRADSSEARVVTICRKGEVSSSNSILGNSQIISAVRAEFAVAEANPSELARLVRDEAVDETGRIEELMERDGGLSDLIVYGVNLTFVNLEEAAFYDFECKGQKPVAVSYRVDGVGEKGAVLVLPGRIDGGGGRLVTVTLPEKEVAGVKYELKRGGLMA